MGQLGPLHSHLIVVISIGFFAHPQELKAVLSSINKHSELVLLLGIILSQNVVGTERYACLMFTEGKKLPSNRYYLEVSLSAHLINHILDIEQRDIMPHQIRLIPPFFPVKAHTHPPSLPSDLIGILDTQVHLSSHVCSGLPALFGLSHPTLFSSKFIHCTVSIIVPAPFNWRHTGTRNCLGFVGENSNCQELF